MTLDVRLCVRAGLVNGPALDRCQSQPFCQLMQRIARCVSGMHIDRLRPTVQEEEPAYKYML